MTADEKIGYALGRAEEALDDTRVEPEYLTFGRWYELRNALVDIRSILMEREALCGPLGTAEAPTLIELEDG